MSKNLYLELSERSKKILKSVIETYLETGEPAGSETILKKIGIDLSSSSIRSILANLQKEGLLYAPHVSAGRLPTDKGMRFFVDGLLEFGRLSRDEQENIKNQCQSRGSSFQEVLNEASKAISGLSNCAGIVVAPKFQNKIKHIEFIKLNSNQVMSIIASENGLVENRILNSKNNYNESTLKQASNYLNSNFVGKTIDQIKIIISEEIKNSQNQLDSIGICNNG